MYEWFFDLKFAALRTGMGATVLSYTEIDSWCRLYCRTLTPWEVSTLRQMDVAFNSAIDKRSEKKKDK